MSDISTNKNTSRKGRLMFLRRIKHMMILIGKLFQRGSYWGRMYCVDSEKKLMYIAVCKTASTSFRSILLNIPWTTSQDFKRDVRTAENYISNIDLKNYADYYKFAFVRNPFSRLVSCYEDRYHNDSNETFFQVYLMGYLAKDKGFKEFAKRVTRIPNFLADRHFCRQYDLLYDKNGKPIYDYLGHFENLKGDFEYVRERFNLAELPHFRTSHGSRVDWRDYYDEPLANAVYQYYLSDIKNLGYEETYQELLKHIRERGTPAI